MSVRILVPLDRSSYCDAASEIALQIAKAQPSQVDALRVVNVTSAGPTEFGKLPQRMGFEPAVVPAALAEERRQEASDLVTAWVERARAQGVEAQGHVEVGKVAHTLDAHAKNADLIVMGLRGETEEHFPKQGGELAAWISQHVAAPVLYTTPDLARLTQVAVGYDGSDSAIQATRAVRRFLLPLGVTVHAIHVSRDGSGEAVLAEVDALLPETEVRHHLVKGTSVHEALVEGALDVGAELLVLGFRGRAVIKDFLFGTATERVLVSGRLSVMVTH